MTEKDTYIKMILYLLLYTSVDTFVFGTNINTLFLYIPRIMALLTILSLIHLKGRTLFTKAEGRVILCYVFMLGSICATSFYYSELFGTAISRILMLSVAISIFLFVDEELYINVFTNFVSLVSVFAIITFVVAYVFPSVLYKLPVIVNTANHTAHTYFFGTIEEENIQQIFKRMQGIFWEPGAFSIYLIFALVIEMFMKVNINIKHISLYVIALLMTFSTTGYVTLSVLFVAFLLDNNSDVISIQIKRLIGLGIIVLIGLTIFFDTSQLYNLVFGKLTSGTSSATTRYSSFFNGLRVAFSHPVLGVGNDYRPYMEKYVYGGSIFNNGGTSVTNTIVGQFVNYGVFFGSLFTIGTFRFFSHISYRRIVKVLLIVTVFLAYFGEKFYSFMPFVFMFYGFGSNDCSLGNDEID